MKEQHRNLYEVWAELSCRSIADKKILKQARKENLLILNADGTIGTAYAHEDFNYDVRYCLKPDYVIPGEVVELKVVESSIRMMKFQAPNGSHWNLDDAQLFKLYFHGYKWADGRISRLLDGPIGEWPICVLWEQE